MKGKNKKIFLNIQERNLLSLKKKRDGLFLKMVFPILLFLFSFEIFLGTILGYFLARFSSKKLKSLVFEIKAYQIHLHHWLLGLIALISCSSLNILSSFYIGILTGVIFEGISSYKDWYQVLKRNPFKI
jgi:uncharacterized Tic20 family protein